MGLFDKIKEGFAYSIVYPQIIIQSNNELVVDGVDKVLFCDENAIKLSGRVNEFPTLKQGKLLEIQITGEDMTLCYIKEGCIRVIGNIVNVSFSE